ncbi:uncharacterized protein [Littorina saxatilis]|uniref:uncharacterized protein isoform X2 n=1 Tax=Littorina saxatilis TaxID=31220 RepID=UPI0038B483B8
MVGIRIAVVLLLAGCAMGDGLGSLLDQASSLQNQAMGMANNVLKHSPEDLAKLALNSDYQRELQQLTQQYAMDPQELSRRTQALNDKYLGGTGSGSGNGGTGSSSGNALSDVMKLARNPDYLREVQQLTQQYASDPEELARRTQALNEKYLNGNGGVNALASFAVMAAAFVVSKLFTV